MNRAALSCFALLSCSCAATSMEIAPEEVFLNDGLVYVYSSYCEACAALEKDVPNDVRRLNIDVYPVYDYFAYESNASRAKELSLGAERISEVYFVYSPIVLSIANGRLSDYASGYADCLVLLGKGASA